MEEYIYAAVFGVIQALTEFLPISSSGHLVLAAELTGDQANEASFDVALHGGTLLAVLAYFRDDWAVMWLAGRRELRRHGLALTRWRGRGKLALLLALGSVPGFIAGGLLQLTAQDGLRQPLVVGIMLIAVGGVMWFADTRGRTDRRVRDVDGRGALFIGAAQALAVVPGTSRSGITISAGRIFGLSRHAAARFSFLLSAPITAGSLALLVRDAVEDHSGVAWGPMALGAIVAFLASMLVIRGLLGFLRRHGLGVFVWYRIVLGAVVLAGVAAGAFHG